MTTHAWRVEVQPRRNQRGAHLAKHVLTNKYKRRPKISLRTSTAKLKLPTTSAPGYFRAYGQRPAAAKPKAVKLSIKMTVKNRLYSNMSD